MLKKEVSPTGVTKLKNKHEINDGVGRSIIFHALSINISSLLKALYIPMMAWVNYGQLTHVYDRKLSFQVVAEVPP